MRKHILKIFDDLENYSIEKFKNDLNAGLVTGIISIPLSLALAITTGVPPIMGLYTACVAGFFAAFFAGSKFSVSGPAAAIAPILAVIVDDFGLDALPWIGIFAGIFLVLFGVLKIGHFIRYVPLSVTLGFTAGVAVVLFFGQLNDFLGLNGITYHEHFHEKVVDTFEHIYTINWSTSLIGIISLFILIFFPKIKLLSKIPASLVAVIVCSLIVGVFPQFFGGVATIKSAYGSIQSGFPPITSLSFPSLSEFIKLIEPSLKLAFLISIESLLCATVADKMTKTSHKSNKELIAQGLSNIITPLFSGMPSTAVIARTATSIKYGAQTRIAAIIHAFVVLMFLLFLANWGGQIPLAVLSAILFITAWKISEQEEIRRLLKVAPKSDIAVLVLTFLLTVFVDLTVAVGVGMVFAVLFVFNRVSTIECENITPDKRFVDEEIRKMLAQHPEIQFINMEGNLSMGAAGSLISKVKIDEKASKVIFRMREIHHIDLSGLEAFKDLIKEIKSENKEVYLTSINKRCKYKLDRYGILDEVDGVYEGTSDIMLSLK